MVYIFLDCTRCKNSLAVGTFVHCFLAICSRITMSLHCSFAFLCNKLRENIQQAKYVWINVYTSVSRIYAQGFFACISILIDGDALLNQTKFLFMVVTFILFRHLSTAWDILILPPATWNSAECVKDIIGVFIYT